MSGLAEIFDEVPKHWQDYCPAFVLRNWEMKKTDMYVRFGGCHNTPHHLITDMYLYRYMEMSDEDLYLSLLHTSEEYYPHYISDPSVKFCDKIVTIRPDFLDEVDCSYKVYYQAMLKTNYGRVHDVRKFKYAPILLHQWRMFPELMKTHPQFFKRNLLKQIAKTHPEYLEMYKDAQESPKQIRKFDRISDIGRWKPIPNLSIKDLKKPGVIQRLAEVNSYFVGKNLRIRKCATKELVIELIQLYPNDKEDFLKICSDGDVLEACKRFIPKYVDNYHIDTLFQHLRATPPIAVYVNDPCVLRMLSDRYVPYLTPTQIMVRETIPKKSARQFI